MELLNFVCPRCGRTSYHPRDVEEGYCPACHEWTADSASGTTTPVTLRQPLCESCGAHRNRGRVTHRQPFATRTTERCCLCGAPTESGIYERIDPATVPYPLTA